MARVWEEYRESMGRLWETMVASRVNVDGSFSDLQFVSL
jgi:hypothetical protein